MKKFCFLSYLLILFSSLSHALTSTTNGTGFSARLFRRNSPISPFYNPNATKNNEWDDTIDARSEARLKYFKSRMEYKISSADDIEIPIHFDSNAEYIMSFSIGTPPFPVTVLADTGGDFLWVQALPCTSCYDQDGPIFDPSKSSSFIPMMCTDPNCAYFGGRCTEANVCAYKITYGDKSFSEGNFAYDKFTFRGAEQETSSISSVRFGCGHKNQGIYTPEEYGNAGLSRTKGSLVNQLREVTQGRFSHCLLHESLRNPNEHPETTMLFGNYARLWGRPTPMKGKDFYYVNLESISINGDPLDIAKGAFDLRENGLGGIILDSGTPLTFLVGEGYWPLQSKILELAKLKMADHLNGRLCFVGKYSDLFGNTLPTIRLYFENSLDFEVPAHQAFKEYIINGESRVCALFKESNLGFSIIGSYFQENLIVGYDLVEEKIYMQQVDDCQAEDD
ncbi:hypothetical protein Cni_G29129 [Canna indica]|uniref:Peptidase A1 domain-containing protein n=1 Tax=Canna indica TaxID=4628 RepID=A0AAQ3QTQ2_9LILI|nr:hypothetical protein Cni_G29129 [Canna indica]